MFNKKISILILIIFIFGASGCTIKKNNSGSPVMVPTPPALSGVERTPENKISPEDVRDNQRISDIVNISMALESYAKGNNGRYLEALAPEKISDEASSVFQTMSAGGYLYQPIKDPRPDKYYYGYRSDGQAYELTAVLENQEGGRCVMAGNYCIYTFKKGEIE